MTPDLRTRWSDAGPDDERAVELFGASIAGRAMCPPPEVVQAAVAGTLPQHLQNPVETHVADCRICRALIAALEDDSVGAMTPEEKGRILKSVRTGIAQDRRITMRRRAWRSAAAAAVVILAGVAALKLWPDSHSAFQLTARELQVLKQIGQRDFILTDSQERAELAEALAPYDKEEFGEARRRLDALVTRRPASIAARFYLGVTNLQVGRHYTALPDLEFVHRAVRTDLPALTPGAAWYLAVAYVTTAQVDLGRKLLENLCSGSGELARRACAGLEELNVPIRVSGMVTDSNGEPLSGVRVGQQLLRYEDIYVVTNPTRLSGTTDAAGRYTVSGAPLALGRPGIIRAAKPGYFTRTVAMEPRRDTRADFSLVPWTLIRLGDVLKGTITRDSPCGSPEESCHEFAVTVPATGTLEVSVEGFDRESMDLYLEAPTGEVYGPNLGAPLRLAIPATAGSTFQIRIMSFSRDPRGYELTTRLK